MPKYWVNLFYHASAAYDVEAADEDAAVAEAKRLNELEPEAQFRERLNMEFTDYDVGELKED
jgi:hypothetical protein